MMKMKFMKLMTFLAVMAFAFNGMAQEEKEEKPTHLEKHEEKMHDEGDKDEAYEKDDKEWEKDDDAYDRDEDAYEREDDDDDDDEAEEREDREELMADAEEIKQKTLSEDPAMRDHFENSTGYVIFPNVGEAAFIVGGASGNGVVYENGTAIGMADLKELDVGLQAGGQAVAEIVFFKTDEAFNEFKEDDLEFSSEASAVLVKSGAAAKASYDDGVSVFAMPKAGVMADLSVGGQRLTFESFDDDADMTMNKK